MLLAEVSRAMITVWGCEFLTLNKTKTFKEGVASKGEPVTDYRKKWGMVVVWRADSLEKALRLGKAEGEGRKTGWCT